MAPTTRAFPSPSTFYHLISYASHAYNSRSPTSEQTSVSSVIFLLFLFSFFFLFSNKAISRYRESHSFTIFLFFFFLFFLRDETFLPSTARWIMLFDFPPCSLDLEWGISDGERRGLPLYAIETCFNDFAAAARPQNQFGNDESSSPSASTVFKFYR